MSSPIAEETAIVPAEEQEEEHVSFWASEPKSYEELMDKYILEAKCPGRSPGTTLLLVGVQQRDGSTTEVLPNQKHKLFIVSGLHEIVFCSYVAGHGWALNSPKH